MSFEEFASQRGYDVSSGDYVGLATVAIQYTKAIKLPNICSFSSHVFTHANPRFDPVVEFNKRFFSAPQDILNIAPAVADYHGQTQEQHWFDEDRENGLINLLTHAKVSWLLFAINPYKYSGDRGHLVGVRNDYGNLSIWDTTRYRPYAEMDTDEVWNMCLSHMFGKQSLVVSFT